jgi:hypothetical protein
LLGYSPKALSISHLRFACRLADTAMAYSHGLQFPGFCLVIGDGPGQVAPGLRLATRPASTGSPPTVKTIGIIRVASLAASLSLSWLNWNGVQPVTPFWKRTAVTFRLG